MKQIPSFHDDLIRRLKNPKKAIGYLNAALEDEDPNVFLLALRYVAEAYGGMTRISHLTHVSREHIYRMLSKKGNPEFKTLQSLLNALELKLSVESKSQLKKAA